MPMKKHWRAVRAEYHIVEVVAETEEEALRLFREAHERGDYDTDICEMVMTSQLTDEQAQERIDEIRAKRVAEHGDGRGKMIDDLIERLKDKGTNLQGIVRALEM